MPAIEVTNTAHVLYVRGALVTALATLTFGTLLITPSSVGAQAGAQAAAQAQRTVQDGVYSGARANRGQALYAQRCAGCHDPALAGASDRVAHSQLTKNKAAQKWAAFVR